MEINKNKLFSHQINEKNNSSLNLSKINLNFQNEKILLKKSLTFNTKNNNKLSLSTDRKNNNKKYNIPYLNLYKNINESILNDLSSNHLMGTFNINNNKKYKAKIDPNYLFNNYNKMNNNNNKNNNKYKINKNKRVTFLINENINNNSLNFNKKTDLSNSSNKNNSLNNFSSIYNSLNNSLLKSKNNPIKIKNKIVYHKKKFSSKILNANLNHHQDYEKVQKLKNINNFLDTIPQENINKKKIYLRRDSFIDKLLLKMTNPDEVFEEYVQTEKPGDKFIRFKNHLIKNKNLINKMIQDSILLQKKSDNFLLHYNPLINKTKYFLKSKYGLYDNEDNNEDNKNDNKN